ncbi:MAG: type II toxin-antitoxin system VapC family toxin [Chitinophagaceae bacterium]
MTYLLDTHYMLWAITDTKKLSKKLKGVLANPDNRILVSAVSFWEVSLKSALGKLQLDGLTPEDLPGICTEIGFAAIPLLPEESSTYHQMKAAHHKDPFDRMLIWQAISNNYTFVSIDATVKKYVSEGLKIYTEKR